MRRGYTIRTRIFLREDGVLGVAVAVSLGGRMTFDARNKWSLNDGQLSISLDNDQIMLNFSIKRINGMLLSSNIQPEPMFTNLRLDKNLGSKLAEF
jgi:hypothetical protein